MVDKKITDFIAEHHVLTLATTVGNRPYCCNCFYKYIEDDNIFVFQSNPDTKHVADMHSNPNIGASIVLETETVGKIQGLQICGKAYEPEDGQAAKANKAYLKRFPYAVLKKGDLWILEPDFFKLTDNRLGFGKKIRWNKNTPSTL